MGVFNATHSLATGGGLTAGVAGSTMTFWVYSYDQYNNVYPIGGQTIEVTVVGPGPSEVTVTDLNNGTYQVQYTVNVTGPYDIVIIGNGAVLGSPTQPRATITAAPAVNFTSTTTDTVPTTTSANVQQVFTVQVRDQYGNPRGVGGDAVVATLLQADPRDLASVTDNLDGTYRVQWTSFLVGPAQQISVTVGGGDVVDSPFTFSVTAGPISPADCIVSTFSQTFEAGVQQSFTITTYDAYNNRIFVGGQAVTATNTPIDPNTVFTVTDNLDGTYVITGVYEKAQFYNLALQMGGSHVAQSPYLISATPSSLPVLFIYLFIYFVNILSTASCDLNSSLEHRALQCGGRGPEHGNGWAPVAVHHHHPRQVREPAGWPRDHPL